MTAIEKTRLGRLLAMWVMGILLGMLLSSGCKSTPKDPYPIPNMVDPVTNVEPTYVR